MTDAKWIVIRPGYTRIEFEPAFFLFVTSRKKTDAPGEREYLYDATVKGPSGVDPLGLDAEHSGFRDREQTLAWARIQHAKYIQKIGGKS